jgi:hypothetical protein
MRLDWQWFSRFPFFGDSRRPQTLAAKDKSSALLFSLALAFTLCVAFPRLERIRV